MSNFSGRVSSSSTFRVPTTRPKVFNATLPHLSVARGHSRRPSREQNAPSRSRDNLGRPFREQNTPFRSRDNLGRPFREQNAPFRSRDDLGRPLREQNAAFRSRDNLGRPLREQNAPSRSRDNLGRPSREQNAPSRSRDDLGRLFREQNAPSRSRDNFGRHRQAPSCTNPISWPLWYTRQASPVPILSPGHFGTPDKPLLYQKLSHSLFRITYFLRSCFELFV